VCSCLNCVHKCDDHSSLGKCSVIVKLHVVKFFFFIRIIFSNFYFFCHKNNVFQAQAGVFSFSCKFQAENIVVLFLNFSDFDGIEAILKPNCRQYTVHQIVISIEYLARATFAV